MPSSKGVERGQSRRLGSHSSSKHDLFTTAWLRSHERFPERVARQQPPTIRHRTRLDRTQDSHASAARKVNEEELHIMFRRLITKRIFVLAACLAAGGTPPPPPPPPKTPAAPAPAPPRAGFTRPRSPP